MRGATCSLSARRVFFPVFYLFFFLLLFLSRSIWGAKSMRASPVHAPISSSSSSSSSGGINVLFPEISPFSSDGRQGGRGRKFPFEIDSGLVRWPAAPPFADGKENQKCALCFVRSWVGSAAFESGPHFLCVPRFHVGRIGVTSLFKASHVPNSFLPLWELFYL